MKSVWSRRFIIPAVVQLIVVLNLFVAFKYKLFNSDQWYGSRGRKPDSPAKSSPITSEYNRSSLLHPNSSSTQQSSYSERRHLEVNIKIQNKHYLGNDFGGEIKRCRLGNETIKCHMFKRTEDVNQDYIDALWYHIPTHFGQQEPVRMQNGVQTSWSIGFSYESSGYYARMNDVEYMSKFDLLMTYRLDSDVVLRYFSNASEYYSPPAIGLDHRYPAVLYVQKNCDPRNGREDIVRDLMEAGVPIHAYGTCLHNQDKVMTIGNDKSWTANVFKGGVNKELLAKHYRVCVAIENSNARDYVSEKLWDSYRWGCVPIYLGAPNVVSDFMPSNDSAILMPPRKDLNFLQVDGRVDSQYQSRSFQDAVKDIQLVLRDDDEYNRRQKWRQVPFHQRSPGYQRIMNITQMPSQDCQMCAKIAQLKLDSLRKLQKMLE
ncbi:hypothetical protein MIR68_010869 [Amoeboaphelidium protococcarum]|nr:hypothetical protein MIR68_010869 [Amoeboaphelidium protococcarum]